MPNKKTFATNVASKVKAADTVNAAGGKAYSLTSEGALAQYVVTGCFNQTFYATAEDQLDKIKELAANCSSQFIAKAAVYGHTVAGMKDTPAYLLAVLANRAKDEYEHGVSVEHTVLRKGVPAHNATATYLFQKAFPLVITNGKMLMNFVQIVRSGVTGRKSFGTMVRRSIRDWLAAKTGNQLFTGSIGGNPSMRDIIKMVHPRPESEEKKALYAYFIDKGFEVSALPSKVRDFEVFKAGKKNGVKVAVPDVPFQMLTSLDLSKDDWVEVGRNLPWNALRMNLNTLARHGVFDVSGMTKYVADKIANPELVRKFNVFPYQLLTAYLNTDGIPSEVRDALQDAMEVATENVPTFGVKTAVCMDTSGSMGCPVTGHRAGSTTKTSCVQVAALAGATVARKNKGTVLLPFDMRVHPTSNLNAKDSIMTNASKLAGYGGGGTDCASAMRVLNGQVGDRPELIIYVSDNESWFNTNNQYSRFGSTGMASEWAQYKRKTPNAKLVCIDIVPNSTTQVSDDKSVLNIGGFSDKVWTAVESFVKNNGGDFVSVINSVEL